MIPSLKITLKGRAPKVGSLMFCGDDKGQSKLEKGSAYVCTMVVGQFVHVADEDGPLGSPFRMNRFVVA